MDTTCNLSETGYPFLFNDEIFLTVYSRENTVTEVYRFHSSMFLAIQQLRKPTRNAYYVPRTELMNRGQQDHQTYNGGKRPDFTEQ